MINGKGKQVVKIGIQSSAMSANLLETYKVKVSLNFGEVVPLLVLVANFLFLSAR